MSYDRALAATLMGLFLLGAPLAAADDLIVPRTLPPAKKAILKNYLAKREKPGRFLPPGAKLVGAPLPGIPAPVEPPLASGARVVEWLAEARPHEATDPRKGPDLVDLYWFRPNPRKGAPGITVKRVLDLNTGKQLGPTEVLLDYSAPLTHEEEAQAIRLARKNVRAVREAYSGAGKGEVEVVALFEQITAPGVPDGAPGDRVVNLQFRRRRSPDVVSVNVNVTKETVREAR